MKTIKHNFNLKEYHILENGDIYGFEKEEIDGKLLDNYPWDKEHLIMRGE